MLRDDRRGHELRDVALGLGAQDLLPGDRSHLPEVVIALGAGLEDPADAGVVAGPGEAPVAGLLVELLQVPRRGPGRLLRIAPLVDPEVLLQAEHLAGGADELPRPRGAGAAVREVAEPALDHREEDGVLREPLLLQDQAVPVHELVGPAEPLHEVLAGGAGLEEADVPDDRLVHLDRDVVLGLELLQIVVELREERDPPLTGLVRGARLLVLDVRLLLGLAQLLEVGRLAVDLLADGGIVRHVGGRREQVVVVEEPLDGRDRLVLRRRRDEGRRRRLRGRERLRRGGGRRGGGRGGLRRGGGGERQDDGQGEAGVDRPHRSSGGGGRPTGRRQGFAVHGKRPGAEIKIGRSAARPLSGGWASPARRSIPRLRPRNEALSRKVRIC